MKEQARISSLQPTSPVERFANDNCLNEPRDSELKRRTTNVIKEFKKFKENTKSS